MIELELLGVREIEALLRTLNSILDRIEALEARVLLIEYKEGVIE